MEIDHYMSILTIITGNLLFKGFNTELKCMKNLKEACNYINRNNYLLTGNVYIINNQAICFLIHLTPLQTNSLRTNFGL